jgi:ubiquinone biosynthesis O-methyltransferase
MVHFRASAQSLAGIKSELRNLRRVLRVHLTVTEISPTNIVVPENVWAYGKRFRFIAQAIQKWCSSSDATRVLDVGCGNGSQVAIPLARLGHHVVGIDTDERSITQAHQYADALPNAHFYQHEVRQVREGKFDCVILSEVLEHVPDPAKLLRESLVHLRPDGIAIVTVPNGYGEFECDSWLFRTLRLDRVVQLAKRSRGSRESSVAPAELASTENHECGHIQFFTLRRLRQIFCSEGLDIVQSKGSCLACGPIAVYTVARIPGYIHCNQRIADFLPLQLSSGWYFVLRRRSA